MIYVPTSVGEIMRAGALSLALGRREINKVIIVIGSCDAVMKTIGAIEMVEHGMVLMIGVRNRHGRLSRGELMHLTLIRLIPNTLKHLGRLFCINMSQLRVMSTTMLAGLVGSWRAQLSLQWVRLLWWRM